MNDASSLRVMMGSVDKLVSKVRAGLERHKGEPASVLVEKVVRSAAALAMARVALRGCDEVGPRARSLGWTLVDNRGRLTIGADFAANCAFCAIELRTEPGGLLAIGDQVTINYGTLLSAAAEVRIGNGVSLGPYCVVCDSDVPPSRSAGRPPRPIVIEDGAWLAGRVTLLPGAHIGAGAVVSAGSIVSGYIPPGTVATGIPARPLRAPGIHPAAPHDTAARPPQPGSTGALEDV